MRAPLRDVERPSGLGVELGTEPLPVRRRARSQVDRDVVDRPSRAADELRLLVRRPLEVHATKRPGGDVPRERALRELAVEARPRRVRRDTTRARRTRVRPRDARAPRRERPRSGSRRSARTTAAHAGARQRPPQALLERAAVEQVAKLSQPDVAPTLEQLRRERQRTVRVDQLLEPRREFHSNRSVGNARSSREKSTRYERGSGDASDASSISQPVTSASTAARSRIR